MTTASVEASDQGGRVRIVVAGEVDMANADTIEREITGAISNQARYVSLDLTDVAYLDSAGLRVLFSLADRLATLQIELGLVAPVGSPARRIIEVAGLDSITSLHPPPPNRTGPSGPSDLSGRSHPSDPSRSR